jgi:Ca-activated chloride channel family protein
VERSRRRKRAKTGAAAPARAGRTPRRASVALLCMLVLAFPFLTGFGDSPGSRNRKGNKYYREGRFDDALTEYRSAQVVAPELPELAFNAGDALYRKGVVPDALKEYAKAAGAADPTLAASASYNAGTAAMNAGDLETAVDLFKASLKLNPADQDAKHNLELALKLLQEQQQQQQNQQQQQDQQDQKDQQEQNQQQQQNQQDQEQQKQDQQEQQQQENQQEQEQQQQEQGQQQQQEQQQEQQGQEQQQPPEPQDQGQEQELKMSPEDAARLLDAIGEQEKELQAELRAAKARKRARVEKDW